MTTFAELIESAPDSWRVDLTEGRPIQLFPWGTWKHEEYGTLELDEAFFNEMCDNFLSNVRGQKIPIDSEHMPDIAGAKGYINRLEVRDGVGLFAKPEWTEYGRQLLGDKRFLYMSPTFLKKWKHPQTGEEYSNVLIAAALTTMPFLKGMEEVALSEGMTCAEPERGPLPELSLDELLDKFDEIGCQIENYMKGKKGMPSARHQLKMSRKLLEEMLNQHFPKPDNNEKETQTMSEETTVAAELAAVVADRIDLTEIQKEAQMLKEKVAAQEAALLAERTRNAELKQAARVAKVESMTADLRAKNILKPGEAEKFQAYALTLAENEDTTNEVRLSEGKEQVNYLNALKSIAETCFYSAEFHTSPDGTAGDSPAALAEAVEEAVKTELSKSAKVEAYAKEHGMEFHEASLEMGRKGLLE